MTDIAPDSVVRDQYEQAFAPGFNIATGFEDPDQVVEDLREMTYTSFVDDRRGRGRLHGHALPRRPPRRGSRSRCSSSSAPRTRSTTPRPPSRPTRTSPGVQTELLEDVGHSPNVEAPERTAALIDGFIVRTEAAERAARRAEARREARKRAARKAARAKARAKAKAEAEAKATSKEKQQGKQAGSGEEGQAQK